MSADWTGLVWRKSTRSNGSGDCAEATRLPNGMIGIRDSKLGDQSPILEFTQSEWDAFRLGIKDGEFDQL